MKRLFTLLTALSLLLGLCAPALAADKDYYAEDQPHADVDFSDMTYVHMEMADIQAKIDAVAALMGDAANAAQVEVRFDALVETIDQLRTMAQLADIKTSQNVYDEEAEAEYAYISELYSVAFDAFHALMRDLLSSPCAAFLEARLAEEDIEYLKNYENMTEEELERSNRQTALVADYYKAVAASGAYPVEVADGVVITLDEAEAQLDAAFAVYYAQQTQEAYEAYYHAYEVYTLAYDGNLAALNDACGRIYLELVALRNAAAREEGYANYMEYAYENVYYRDYTPSDIHVFADAVKAAIPDINAALTDLVGADSANPVYTADYTGSAAFEMMRPYVGRISAEAQESFDYMMDHHLYDYGYGSGAKDGTGFTTILASYGAPFTFNTPSGTLYDFSTAVHEFGHYNRYYWTPQGLFDYTDDIDQAEVHSQGMELIFTQFYHDIFGEDSKAVTNYLMANLTSALVNGCLHDEFQQYAYATENVTLEMLNQEYYRLNVEYGQTPEGDDGHGYYSYGWVYIPHTFERPGYYISYATSAAGAFSFWLDAQENGYEAATDAYMTYASLPAELGFREGLAKAGVDDPLTQRYVQELAAALSGALDIDSQLYTLQMDRLFIDVNHTQYFAEAVWFVKLSGIMTGVGGGRFDPDRTATRAEAAAVLWRFMDMPAAGDASFVDLAPGAWYTGAVGWAAEAGIVNGVGGRRFAPDSSVTREQFAVMLYRLAKANGLAVGEAGADLSQFRDAGDVSASARTAVAWAVGAGILRGMGGKTIAPAQSITRAQMAIMLYRFCAYAGVL